MQNITHIFEIITYKKHLHYHESEAEMFFILIKSPYRTGRIICMCCTFHLRSGLNGNAKQRKCLVEYRSLRRMSASAFKKSCKNQSYNIGRPFHSSGEGYSLLLFQIHFSPPVKKNQKNRRLGRVQWSQTSNTTL